MPKRNRAKEIKKHGALVERPPAPEQKPAVVTSKDLVDLGGLTLWAHRYANYMYSIGGHGEEPQPKRYTEPIRWQQGEYGRHNRNTISIAAGARGDLEFPGFTGDMDEYRRQKKDGVMLNVDTQRTVSAETGRRVFENVELTIDAEGNIVGGKYRWAGDSPDWRPAPNAHFDSIHAAHKVTVSGRAAELIGRFRDLVLDPPEDTRLHGLWGFHESITPPEEFLPIPHFEIPDVS